MDFYHLNSVDFMGYTEKDFNNPMGMFEMRTRQIRVRIQTLQSFLVVAQHPYSKAIVEQELAKSVDEYVARKLQQRTQETN